MIKSLSERHLRFRPAADLICHIGPCRWAFVMEDIELSEAVQDCRGRKEGIRYWANHRANQEIGAATVSFGVAWLPIPTKNFDAQILFEKAERCLSGAQLSGGDTIKSISV
jgi:GGDEF domain-containing protein